VALSVQVRVMVKTALAAEAASPVGAAGTVGGLASPWVRRNQLKLATAPPDPLESKERRTTCRPADRFTPLRLTVRHACQSPVLGTMIGPVRLTPSTSR